MKIRTPDCQCLICHPNGEVIIKAVGNTTLQAIQRMRKLITAMEEERHAREKEERQQPVQDTQRLPECPEVPQQAV